MARPAKSTTGAAGGRKRRPLTRGRVLSAAHALIERGGLAAFSMRGLGARLGCEPMSVYHYFPSKAHLLDALVDRALAGVTVPPPGADPEDRLRQMCREYRAMARRQPKLYQLIALHRLNTPMGVRFIESVLTLIHALSPDPRFVAQSFRALGYYLTGAALDETAGYASGPSAVDAVSDDYIAQECPRLSAAAPYFKAEWWDSTFELGLETLLAGIRAAAKPGSSAQDG
jgi:AcrR family transcriptional regulator